MMASRHLSLSNLLSVSGDGPAGGVLAAPSHDGPMAVHIGSYAGVFDGGRMESSMRDKIDAADAEPPSSGAQDAGALLMKSLMQYGDVPPHGTLLQSSASVEADLPLARTGEESNLELEDSVAKTCPIDGSGAWDASKLGQDPTIDLAASGEAC